MNESSSIRHLKHDIANDLGVIRMGLEALGGSRENADDFAEVMSMLSDSIAGLKSKVETLVEIVDDRRLGGTRDGVSEPQEPASMSQKCQTGS